ARVLVAPDGRIVVAGSVMDSPMGSPGSFALARYNPDGSPDRGFGTGGQVITPGLGLAATAALQADGKIVVVGGNFVLARYNATDGSLDPSFGTGGTVTTHFTGPSAVQPTGVGVQA